MRRFFKISLVAGLISLAVLLVDYGLTKDNIHTVVPGEIYRSAQLEPSHFVQLIAEKHIQTIINLRGYHPRRAWYQEEMSMVKQTGVHHYDLGLHAHKLPTHQQLKQLITWLKTAPKPILIHCEAGADRTGFASTIVLLLRGKSLAEAKKQSSFKYWVVAPDSIGKLFVKAYSHWLQIRGLTHAPRYFYAFTASPYNLVHNELR